MERNYLAAMEHLTGRDELCTHSEMNVHEQNTKFLESLEESQKLEISKLERNKRNKNNT